MLISIDTEKAFDKIHHDLWKNSQQVRKKFSAIFGGTILTG